MTNAAHEKRIFAAYDEARGPALAALCVDLLATEKAVRLQLAAAYADLDTVRVREIPCDGFPVKLQFNPRRIVSSAARVDPESIRARKCFLCPSHLPPEQRGVLYRGAYLILCNPAPIFPLHFTVSALRHLPQSLEGNLSVLLSLAEDFSNPFTVLYNGPRCGASAPDHLHFQIVPGEGMPIEAFLGGRGRKQRLGRRPGVSLHQIDHPGRPVLFLVGKERGEVESALKDLFSEMKGFLGETEEPMMNIHCSHRRGRWRIAIFLRRKHRPDDYFREDGKQLLVSPGAIDMGGLMVLPREKEFNALGPDRVRDIYREVCLEQEVWKRLLAALGAKP